MQKNTGTQKRKILVVDDQQGWRELLEDFLTQDGYEVKTADSIYKARDLLNSEKFDIAVLDMRLVDESQYNIDGMKILKEIKEKDPSVKAIILTGYADEDQKESALNVYNADGYFEKAPDGEPFDIDEFTQIVSNLIK